MSLPEDPPGPADWERAVREFLDEPVPEPAMEQGVRVATDVLTAAVAGSGIDYLSRIGREADFSPGAASVLGGGRTLDPGQAALVNASAGVAQEIEEGHNRGGHVGVGIVTGGFALAEHADADGETFVEACVKAYEVCVRLESALFAMKGELYESIPWLIRNPHSTWTTVGPALAGAIAAGLEGERIEAFEVAANLAVVSMHDPLVEGAPSRNVTAGFSAQAGVNAALTAAAGLEGSREAMREVYDPLRELVGSEAFDREFERLGEVWEVRNNYFKPYPSCRYTHPAIEAVRAIEEPIDPDDVTAVDVHTFRNAVDLDHRTPRTLTSAKFSVPYTVARFIESGDVRFDHFDEAAIGDERVQALADRVDVHLDPEFEAAFNEEWGARVEVELADGRTLEGVCERPRFDYREGVPDGTLTGKFREALAWRFDDERADRALEACLDLRDRPVRAVGEALR